MARITRLHSRPEDFAEAMRLLNLYGIAPASVSQDGFNNVGYMKIWDGEENLWGYTFNSMDTPKKFMEWPEGFPVARLITLVYGVPVQED